MNDYNMNFVQQRRFLHQKPMTLKRKSLLLSLLVLASAVGVLRAQDFHYSQFYNAPLRLNPALTGVFGGDTRLSANYRSQWLSVPVKYKTFTVEADHKFIRRTDRAGFFAAGLALNHDRSGDSRLSWANVDLSGSYTRYLSRQWFLTAGIQAGFAQRSFKLDDLRFDEQFDPLPGRYNPNLPIGESFGRTSHVFFDLGTGINLRWQALQTNALVDRLDRRSQVDVGVGVFHLNRPDQSFVEDVRVPLPVRVSPYVKAVVQLGLEADAVGAFTAQFQQPYTELVGMLGLRLHLSRELGNQVAIQPGVAYRFNQNFGDAIIPTIELHFNTLHAGFSYDINISDFQIATDKRGGPEFFVRYIIKKVRPLPEFKICPLI